MSSDQKRHMLERAGERSMAAQNRSSHGSSALLGSGENYPLLGFRPPKGSFCGGRTGRMMQHKQRCVASFDFSVFVGRCEMTPQCC
jgi:hypothetical protein